MLKPNLSYVGSLFRSLKNKTTIIPILTAVIAVLFWVPLASLDMLQVKGVELFKETPVEVSEKVSVKLLKIDNLPIADIERYAVSDAKGVAIFIPQIHRNPGTSVKDPSNNNAVITQNQIYEIIDYMTKELDIRFVASEGDLYGPIDKQKITKIRSLVGSKNKDTNRELILKGAPYKLKAENDSSFVLYGLEEKETREESAAIVKDYIYLNSRLSQLNSSSRPNISLLKSSYDSPTITKNPYANEYSQAKLKLRVAWREKQINEVIIDRRNKETAVNFARGLEDTNQITGILQFGAGHKERLIKELNKNKISVIVVTPDRVDEVNKKRA